MPEEILNPIIWTQDVRCKFCSTKFTVTPETVKYEDLRPEWMFTPDYQFFTNCPTCERINILSNIPSRVAVWIQIGTHQAS